MQQTTESTTSASIRDRVVSETAELFAELVHVSTVKAIAMFGKGRLCGLMESGSLTLDDYILGSDAIRRDQDDAIRALEAREFEARKAAA